MENFKMDPLTELLMGLPTTASIGEDSAYRCLIWPAFRVQLYTAMLTEWDPGKARLNARKHGISFADVVAVLEDEGALTMRDPFSDEENAE
jgi:hypothetical protein